MPAERLTFEEDQKRRKCHKEKKPDTESARECGISPSAYRCWRINRRLPKNDSQHNKGAGRVEYRKPFADKELVEKERVVLTAADIANYNHNDNSKIRNSEKIILSVQISEPEQEDKLLPPVACLADRIKARNAVLALERQRYHPREEANNLAYL